MVSWWFGLIVRMSYRLVAFWGSSRDLYYYNVHYCIYETNDKIITIFHPADHIPLFLIPLTLPRPLLHRGPIIYQ